ncbi:MAG TPA: WD40 repeat domain-containing protein [Vampirovibrionales bacterium]
MDWTTPLKFQQADFIKRLNHPTAALLHCQSPGLHGEQVTIAGERFRAVHAACEQRLSSAQSQPPISEQFRDRLRHQLGVEAVATYLAHRVTPIDPNQPSQSPTPGDFTLKANPAIALSVQVLGGSPSPLVWDLELSEIKHQAAIIFVLIREPIHPSRSDYHPILAGFLPTHLIAMSEGRARLCLDDLFYMGGLNLYLESLSSIPVSTEWLRILTGSSNYVYPVAISADGGLVASSSYDGTIKLWKLRDREITQALCGHSWSFYPIAGGQGGQSLASGSTEKKLNLWQRGRGDFIRTLGGHTSGVSAIAISEDSKILVSGGYDGTIEIWDLVQGQRLRTLNGHSGTVRPMSLSPDGTILATGGIDKKLNLWNLQTGALIRSFNIDTDVAISLAISPNGKLLVSGSQDGTIKIWNLETGCLIRAIAAHSGIVRGVTLSHDGKTLASGSVEKTIKLWSVDTGDLLRTLTGHPDPTITFAIDSEGPTLDTSLLRHYQPGWEEPRQWQ